MAGTQYIGDYFSEYLPGTADEAAAVLTGEVPYAYGGLLRDAAIRDDFGPSNGSGASATQDRPFIESLALKIPDFLNAASRVVGAFNQSPNTSAGMVRRVVDPRTGQIILLPGGQIGGPTGFQQPIPGYLQSKPSIFGLSPTLILVVGAGAAALYLLRGAK